MDEMTKLTAQDGTAAPAAERAIAVPAPARPAAPDAPPSGPAAPDKAPAVPLVTLDDYCAAKSQKMRGHVEIISAFNTLETRKHHLLDTSENYDAAFDALRARPAQ